MLPKQLEGYWEALKKDTKKQIILGVIIICIFIIGTVSSGFLIETGKKLANNTNGQKAKKEQQKIIKKQELNKIYQDNKVVGEITEEVKIEGEGDYIFFEELSETSDLNREIPFEYQEVKYIIIEIKKEISEYRTMRSKKEFVLKSVLCKKFK